jgi:hypothetical protein
MTKKTDDGFIKGLKINYSVFYKYDNFFNMLISRKLFNFGENEHNDIKNEKIVGKEHLSLGSEFIYLFDKNEFITSATGKLMVTNNDVRFHKNLLFKKCGDLFNSLNLAIKFNVIKK